jgi:hypothetical protein
MERRRFLSWLATVSAGGLAGCIGTPAEGSQNSSTPVPVDTESPSTPGLAVGDVGLPVPKQRLELAGFWDSIPAITEPAYAEDWSEVRIRLQRQALSSEFDFEFEPRLTAETPVIGVERRGTARAYPLDVLNWFEVVNDVFPAENGADEPVLVTH